MNKEIDQIQKNLNITSTSVHPSMSRWRTSTNSGFVEILDDLLSESAVHKSGIFRPQAIAQPREGMYSEKFFLGQTGVHGDDARAEVPDVRGRAGDGRNASHRNRIRK